MIDILEELYNGKVDAVHQKMSKKYQIITDKEITLLNKIKELITSEIKDLLEEYERLNNESTEQLALERYKIGFKTGLQIGLELNKK